MPAKEPEADELVDPSVGGGSADRQPLHDVLGPDDPVATDPARDFAVARGQHRPSSFETSRGWMIRTTFARRHRGTITTAWPTSSLLTSSGWITYSRPRVRLP